MKRITIITMLLSGCTALGMLSCTDMDDYKKISGDQEIVYPGKITEVSMCSGDGRIVVKGLCNSDPKIVSCRIYWNLKSDYVEVPVDMSTGQFSLDKEITLKEGTYNFDIYTYDAHGNMSIPVNATCKSYGDLYKSSISNRLVKSFKMNGNNAIIEWWGIDTTLGSYETEITYTNTLGAQITVNVPVEEMSTKLENFDVTTQGKYVTLYRPDSECLDIFRSVINGLAIE